MPAAPSAALHWPRQCHCPNFDRSSGHDRRPADHGSCRRPRRSPKVAQFRATPGSTWRGEGQKVLGRSGLAQFCASGGGHSGGATSNVAPPTWLLRCRAGALLLATAGLLGSGMALGTAKASMLGRTFSGIWRSNAPAAHVTAGAGDPQAAEGRRRRRRQGRRSEGRAGSCDRPAQLDAASRPAAGRRFPRAPAKEPLSHNPASYYESGRARS